MLTKVVARMVGWFAAICYPEQMLIFVYSPMLTHSTINTMWMIDNNRIKAGFGIWFLLNLLIWWDYSTDRFASQADSYRKPIHKNIKENSKHFFRYYIKNGIQCELVSGKTLIRLDVDVHFSDIMEPCERFILRTQPYYQLLW